MRGRSRALDTKFEGLAVAGGVVPLPALISAGIDEKSVRVRIRDGWLRRAGRGLYVIEHLRDDLTQIALVQARYPRSVAAGRASAWLYGTDGYDRVAELTADAIAHPDHQISKPVRPRPPNFLVAPIPRRDVVTVRGVRTLARLPALVSLGAFADLDAVEAAVEWALRTQAVSDDELWAAVAEQQVRTPGIDTLRTVLDRRGRWTPPTESYLETLTVQKVLRPAGLAHRRQVPVWVDGSFLGRYDFELECGLLVEASGAGTHATRAGLQRDASHGMRLRLAGRQVEHLTWDDVTKRPWFTARRLQDYARHMTPPERIERVFASLEA